MGIPPVRLLDKVRQCIRLKGYSIRTEKSYVSWIKRYILSIQKAIRKAVKLCAFPGRDFDSSSGFKNRHSGNA